ncbi:MAG: hypothetical protein WCG45_03390 [bacterium]
MSFNENIYKDYLSKALGNEQSESIYQISIPKIDAKHKSFLETKDDYKSYEVKLKYIDDICINLFPLSEIAKYLDYHYSKYSDEKTDFVDFIEWTIKDINEQHMSQPYDEEAVEDGEAEFALRLTKVREWIEESRKGFKTGLKVLAPKEYISHPQQILLFERLGVVKYLQTTLNLPSKKVARIISFLSNRGFDNTITYIRYVERSKDDEKVPKGKINMIPNTPANIEVINRIWRELGLSD